MNRKKSSINFFDLLRFCLEVKNKRPELFRLTTNEKSEQSLPSVPVIVKLNGKNYSIDSLECVSKTNEIIINLLE